MRAPAIFMTTSATALALACSLVLARAEPVDHSAHGAAAPAPIQWIDPGKAQTPPATVAEAPTGDASKSDEHAGHHGGGEGMGGMGHGGGMMGGMGGMMGGMNHGGGAEHGAGAGMGAMMGKMMHKMMCGFTEHLDGRLAYLKAELKLTDQQQPAWNSFADAWRAVAQKAQTICAAPEEAQDHSKPPVLAKLSMMEKHMANHLEIVRAQKAAIEPLFTALSDEQKKIASETMTGIMKVGKSMGDGGMMGGMMGGMGGMMGHSGGGMQH
ncbi:Spy/CpxP family protein refolding chaperone [Methylocystis iwaonis]|uniref:Spy/CpxP family protein refolding chaperone n=1 Tax=Methylocystis iwaonis TaxID=2885079 RepID=UPI002E7AE8FF|nr:Spy/CpxP family protein refolding chaperone [Methylocystis iwaonis]